MPNQGVTCDLQILTLRMNFFHNCLKFFHFFCQIFGSWLLVYLLFLGNKIFLKLKPKEDVMTPGIIRKENGRASMPAQSFSGLVDHIFQNNLDRFFTDGLWGANSGAPASNVPVNLQETDKSYEMQLVAPGLRKEDFKINLEGDLLTVSFEQKAEANEENKKQQWLRREYKILSFTRTFNLDDSLDPNKISAQYRDGILYLTLPKKEGAQRISRNVEIK